MSNPIMPIGVMPPVHMHQMPLQQQQQPRIPPTINPQQQILYQQQQQQLQIVDDQKRLSDMFDGLSLLLAIRDDMNTILDNVAKANQANSSLALKANETNNEQANKKMAYAPITPNQTSTNVATPSSVGNVMSQQQTAHNEQENNSDMHNDEILNLEHEQIQFLQITDTKFLQNKTEDLNKNLNELEKIIKDIQPVIIKDAQEFIPLLVDQSDSNISGTKFINNFRWITKVQETINCTSLPTYKRFSQTYLDKKNPKYKSYGLKPIKIEELDKYVSSNLHNDIKVKTHQKSENEFVLDIIMPQNFKFVMLLFDCNVEKLQVRPIDTRHMRTYSNKLDEVHFDFEHKNTSVIFQKLEESCLFACAYFRTEYGLHHLKYILQWLKYFVNLFNAKCSRCEKHLLNCLPPTIRDFKTYEPFHIECLYHN